MVNKYLVIAFWIVNASNSNYSVDLKVRKIARYLEQLEKEALKYGQINAGFSDEYIQSQFNPPFPKESDILP